MSEPKTLTIPELQSQLQATTFGLKAAMDQRNAAQNEAIEATVARDQARSVAQALQEQLAAARAEIARLTEALASRATQRAGKRK